MRPLLLLAVLTAALGAQAPAPRSAALDLWERGIVAFGIFVPRDAAARTAAYASPLYDFLFLNLESRYDPAEIRAVVGGLRAAATLPRKTLIVRIPPVEREGADAVRSRIAESFALGADGVTVPHVSGAREAAQVLEYFRESGANVWTASKRRGDKLAMLMIEDTGALAETEAIADLKSYSILACGIGSLTQALGGNRDAAEAGNRKILDATRRAGLVNMLTTTTRDVSERVAQGYLALIAQGADADRAIEQGRKAAGR